MGEVSITALRSLSNEELVVFFRELDDAFFTTQEYVEKPLCAICMLELLLTDWRNRELLK